MIIRAFRPAALLTLLLLVFLLAGTAEAATPSSGGALCYLVADNDGSYGSPDALSVLSSSNVETLIGSTGTEYIEAIAFQPSTRVLFAANSGKFGRLDLTTGVFHEIGSFGSGAGEKGVTDFGDIDGLAFDPHTGLLYGSVRKDSRDLLIIIDPVTGRAVRNAFGYGKTYVVVTPMTVGSVRLDDVDDIAIDPEDGKLYGILNKGGLKSRLILIDKMTGATTDVTDLDVENVEGLTFSADGTLLGVLADNYRKVVVIDRTTGSTTMRATLGSGGNTDYEAISCLTDDTNEISGRVFMDEDGNGTFGSYDTPFEGALLALYRDENSNGLVDDFDSRILTTTSASDGTYAFRISSYGGFLVAVDAASLPDGAVLTTDAIQPADFTGFGQIDEGNDFGFRLHDGTVDLELEMWVDNSYPHVGDDIVYTLKLRNDSSAPVTATGIAVANLLPDGVWFQSASESVDRSGQKLTWRISKLHPGEFKTLEILVRVEKTGNQTNCAQVWEADQPDVDSAYGNGYDAKEDDDACASITVPEGTSKAICYLAADNDNHNGSRDVLTMISSAGIESVIGPTGTRNLEALAYQISTGTLFGADMGRLGTLDLLTGVFTEVGVFGSGHGSQGHQQFGDVDGLTFDPFSGVLFASVRRVGRDLLIKVDPKTGKAIKDGFGPDKDYVAVESIKVGHLTLDDVDDIAVDSFDGRLYGILNSGGRKSRLILIDRTTGATTDLSDLDVENVEGLGFAADGTMLGILGDRDRKVVVVNRQTGTTTVRARLGIDGNLDYEGISCLTDLSNEISGTVFFDENLDGIFNYGEAGQAGVQIDLYRDKNGNGKVDAHDLLVASTTSAINGTYGFWISALGDFVIETIFNTYPSQAVLTTDNVETANFTAFGQVDTGNDFGFALGNDVIDLELTKEVDTSSPRINDVVTFTITLVNAGPADATGVKVRDIIPYGLHFKGAWTSQGGYDDATGFWTVGSLAAGQSVVLDIQAKVTVTNTIENIAQVTHADQLDADSTPGNGIPEEDDQDNALVTARSGGGGFVPSDCTDMGTINALVYDSISKQLFAGTENGMIHISNDEGKSWPPFLLTDNRAPIKDIVVADNGALFAVTKGNGAFISDDAGDTWRHIGPANSTFVDADYDNVRGHLYAADRGAVRIWDGLAWSLLGSTSNPFGSKQIVAVVIDEASGTVYAAAPGLGIYAYKHGAWKPFAAGLPVGVVNALHVAPSGSIFAGTNTDGIYILDGTTWKRYNSGLEGLAIETISSGPNGELLAGTRERGAWYFDHGTYAWIEARNLPVYTVSSVTAHASGEIYAGSAGQGVFKFIDSNMDGTLDQWHQVSTLVANAVIQDIVKAPSGELYAATYGYGVLYSNDGGQCWTRMNRGLENLYTYAIERRTDGTLFIGIWADGKGGVWRSTDNARSWQFMDLGNRQVISLAIDPNDEDVMYAGINLEWGSVYKSEDGGYTWRQLNSFGDPAWAIEVDPNDSNTIVVGTVGKGVWRSTDGGMTFAPYGDPSGSTGMGTAAVWELSYGPMNGPYAGELFAATSNGVFRYDTSSGWWELFGHGSEHYDVRTIEFMYDVIFAGTWGKGILRYNRMTGDWDDAGFGDLPVIAFAVFEESRTLVVGTSGQGVFIGQDMEAGMSTANEGTPDMDVPETFQLDSAYPNPFNPQTTIPFSLTETGIVRLAVHDVLGRRVAVLVDGTLPAGNHQVTFDASGIPSGTYLVRLEAQGRSDSRMVTLLK